MRAKLDEDIASQLKPTADDVTKFSKVVEEGRSIIAELEECLVAERKELALNIKGLRKSENKLAKLSKPLRKEYHKKYKEADRAGLAEVRDALKQEKLAKKELKATIRKERYATIKNTVKGSLSYAFGMVQQYQMLV